MSGKTVDGLMELVKDYGAYHHDELSDSPVATFDAIRTYAEALAAPQEQPAPSVHQLCSLWFDEWELILPPDARESFRNDLLPSVGDAGVPGTYKDQPKGGA